MILFLLGHTINEFVQFNTNATIVQIAKSQKVNQSLLQILLFQQHCENYHDSTAQKMNRCFANGLPFWIEMFFPDEAYPVPTKSI